MTKLDVDEAEKRWTELVQFNDKYDALKRVLFMMTDKYKDMWNGDLEKTSVAKHRISLGSPNTAPIYAALDKAGPRQCVLEKEEFDQVIKAGVMELATKE